MYFKIRAWDKERKIMYYPRSLGFVDGELEFIDRNNEKLNEFGNPSDVVLMCFTGLKDKNGKEIYEGDIIKSNDGMVCEIVYEEEWCRFVCVYKNGAVGHMPFIIEEDGNVIGNVFENLELLRE